MVDAVGTIITKIIEAALKIKRAADTLKQNEDVCKQIKSRVEILSFSLSQHQSNRELMSNSAVRKALEALEETLGEALKLVLECQAETNFMCLFYNSGNLSQRLIKVEQHISSKNVDATFAIMSNLLQFNQYGAHPQPQQMSRQDNQDGGDVSVQTGNDDSYELGVSTADVVSEWDYSMVALCSCCAMAKKSEPGGQLRSLLHQIAAVALQVKDAGEMVLQNKEDCIEIDKRMRRVSAILSQLENTEMAEEKNMRKALEKLLQTFLDARSLVVDCQSSGFTTMFFHRPPSKLSKQIRVVLDKMVSDINGVIVVLFNHTLHPQRY